MTVSAASIASTPVVGNNTWTVAYFSFTCFSGDEIEVIQTEAGAATTLAPDADYTVTLNADQSLSPGGSITLTVAPTPEQSTQIVSAVPYQQPTELPTGGRYNATVLEQALDYLELQIKQVRGAIDSAVRAPTGETLTALGPAAARLDLMPVFNAITGDAELSSFTVTQVASAIAAAYTGAAGPLDALSFIRAGADALTRTAQEKVRDIINAADTVGVDITGVSDSTAGLQDAFDALPVGRTLVLTGTLKLNGVIEVTTSGVGIHFDNCTLNIGDTGAAGTLTNGASGKIGLLFKSTDRLCITGSARLIGQGTVGTTSLAGMVFDSCDHAQCPATFYYENMALGRMVAWCDHGNFGDITAYHMKGKQTFESPPTNSAGSAEVVLGCVGSTFGRITSRENYKPIRYLSVAVDGAAASIDNTDCTFGFVTGTVATASTEGSVCSIRSAKRCQFEGGSGNGFSLGFYLVRYAGDGAWSIDGNIIDSITGNYPATGASVDAALYQDDDGTGMTMGTNHVKSIHATCAGEFGVFISLGGMTIDAGYISGSTRPLVGDTCTLDIGTFVALNQAQEAVAIGQGCNFSADLLDIRSGSTGGVTSAVKYLTAYGSGGVGSIDITSIKYRHNSVATDVVYVYFDPTNGFESARVLNIDGTGTTAPARWVDDAFKVNNGRYLSTVPPTTGAYTVGSLLWNSAPASGGTPGWSCTTAGTPGTWKAMANLA